MDTQLAEQVNTRTYRASMKLLKATRMRNPNHARNAQRDAVKELEIAIALINTDIKEDTEEKPF